MSTPTHMAAPCAAPPGPARPGPARVTTRAAAARQVALQRRRAEQLRVAATGHLYGLDPAAPSLEPTGSRLGDALAALAAAVHAAQHRLGRVRPGLVWALLGRFGLIQSLASARAG